MKIPYIITDKTNKILLQNNIEDGSYVLLVPTGATPAEIRNAQNRAELVKITNDLLDQHGGDLRKVIAAAESCPVPRKMKRAKKAYIRKLRAIEYSARERG